MNIHMDFVGSLLGGDFHAASGLGLPMRGYVITLARIQKFRDSLWDYGS